MKDLIVFKKPIFDENKLNSLSDNKEHLCDSFEEGSAFFNIPGVYLAGKYYPSKKEWL